LRAEFLCSALEILGGTQSRFPHPVSPGMLRVDPMPSGKSFQSLDFSQRVFSDIDQVSTRVTGAANR